MSGFWVFFLTWGTFRRGVDDEWIGRDTHCGADEVKKHLATPRLQTREQTTKWFHGMHHQIEVPIRKFCFGHLIIESPKCQFQRS